MAMSDNIWDKVNFTINGEEIQGIKPMKQPAVRRSVTITLPLDIAETLQALIDGSVGTSDNDDFNEQMAIVLKKLDKAGSKHYA